MGSSDKEKVHESLENYPIKDENVENKLKTLKSLLPGWKTVVIRLSSLFGAFILLAVWIIGGKYRYEHTI